MSAHSIHFPVAIVGVEHTTISVLETDGVVQLCAIVSSPDINCPISFSFGVGLSTADGTTGNLQHCVTIVFNNIQVYFYLLPQTKLRTMKQLTFFWSLLPAKQENV